MRDSRRTETMPDAATEIARSPATHAPSRWRRHRRALIAGGVALIVAAGYFGAGAVVAYTSDAYVRSDLVAIAPEVAGIVQSVAIQDNQKVAAGDLLPVIDPRPYQLDVDLKQQQVAGLEAAVAVKSESQASDAASLDVANARARPGR